MSVEAVERATETLQKQLRAIVGSQYVSGGEERENRRTQRRKRMRESVERRQSFTRLADCAIDGVTPAAMVSPASEEEVASVLRLANENDYVVVPSGGMTKRHLGATPRKVDILLRTDRLNHLVHYDAGDLTMGAGAGMRIADIQQTLATNSQFLPLDPMLTSRATIGGTLAANANGPMRSGFGGVRDYCIGVNFVTGDGEIAKGGGKVVKNVAGYDLMKLMIGSMGTLGIITSANFKVFPKPQQTATFVCECKTLEEAIKLRDRIMASPLSPICLELVSPRAQEYLHPAADVRDPDDYAPLAGMQHDILWLVLVRAAGSDSVLRRYRSNIAADVTRELSGKDQVDFWTRVSDFEDSIFSRHRNAMTMNVSVAPSAVGPAYEAAAQSAEEHNLLSACIGRASAGSLVFAFMPLGVDPPSAMQFANTASSLRSRLPKGSSAIVTRCPLESKSHFDVWGGSPTDFAVMRGIRDAMDPKHILNWGRFIV